jgi:Tol biopolymer transport system component
VNTTVSGNHGTVSGGINVKAGTLTMVFTTVAANHGPGLSIEGAATVTASVVADQIAGTDCATGTASSGGRNVTSDASCGLAGAGDRTVANAGLGPLVHHGGLGRTLHPVAGSPVLNRVPVTTAGACDGTVTTDARGVARPKGTKCDAGAVERDCTLGCPTAATERVPASPTPNGWMSDPAMSGSGRYASFTSGSTNHGIPDTNGSTYDIYVYDRDQESFTIASRNTNGIQANSSSLGSSVSSSGRYVSFQSTASNLDPADTTFDYDTFLRDEQAGTTRLVSLSGSGRFPFVSDDGNRVIYSAAGTAWVWDGVGGTITNVHRATDGTVGNGSVEKYDLSADGSVAVFDSDAVNLVPGDTNGARDVFVRDLDAGVTTRVSIASDGTPGNRVSKNPSVSANGRYVVFRSAATNLASGDTNGIYDIYVHDRWTGQTTRVSLASDGAEPNRDTTQPEFSPDGRYVVFSTRATNLVPGGPTTNTQHIYRHDRATHLTSIISVSTSGVHGNRLSESPDVSTTGATVFSCEGNNLVPGDSFGKKIYIQDPEGA